MEQRVHDRLPFHRSRKMLEIGCGVGAQTEILLRHFPELHVTGIDAAEDNLAEARRNLGELVGVHRAFQHAPQQPRLERGAHGRRHSEVSVDESFFDALPDELLDAWES